VGGGATGGIRIGGAPPRPPNDPGDYR
jgi:hypothetical protein